MRQAVVIEPQCWGFEHAVFNAALLCTVQEAFPGARVHFMGESKHLSAVQEVLERSGGTTSLVCKPVIIPARSLTRQARLRADLACMHAMLQRIKALRADVLVASSLATTGVLALKMLLPILLPRTPTLAVVHSCLQEVLLKARPRPSWGYLLNLKTILSLPTPRSLRLVALGAGMLEALLAEAPNQRGKWIAIDLPYLWPKEVELRSPLEGGPIRFGHFGRGGRNFDMFQRLAEEVGAQYPKAEFWQIGFNSAGVPASSGQRVLGISKYPLSTGEYSRRAMEATYAVLTRDPEDYRLSASATFHDSLAYLKPIIGLKNPYVEYYARRIGDIGYFCDGYDEIRNAVMSIMHSFPHCRYRRQIENMKAGRRIFDPEIVASNLREAILRISN
jgi:hypothetical protein